MTADANGVIKVSYRADGRIPHTYPPHEWAVTLLARLRLKAAARKKLPDGACAAARLDGDAYDDYDEQADACRLQAANVYKMVQCAALGALDESLFAALKTRALKTP